MVKRREELCYIECKHACVEALKPFHMYKISKINPCIYGWSLLNIIYLNQVNKVQSNEIALNSVANNFFNQFTDYIGKDNK